MAGCLRALVFAASSIAIGACAHRSPSPSTGVDGSASVTGTVTYRERVAPHSDAIVELAGSSIRFGAVGSTRMACAIAVSLQEIKYFDALEAANRFAIEGGTLSIFGGGARDPLRFAPASP
jgi:hypothetical protein